MEDFCQLDLRLSEEKYKGSYERCAKIIEQYSSQAKLDISELFLRLIFSFVIGNSDMHLKNFSLIETGVGNNEYVLSPAYDLLPVNIIMPEDKEEFALAMNGKKSNLNFNDFLIFAERIGIENTTAKKMINKITNLESSYLELCEQSALPISEKEKLKAFIAMRCSKLK